MGIDDYLVFAVGDDGFRHAASGDDVGGGGKRGDDLVDETVDHGGGAVEDAALHAFKGVSAYEMGWFLDGDGGELRGSTAKGTEGCFHARDNHSAEKTGVFIDNSDGGGRTEVNNYDGSTIAAYGSDGIGKAILTQLRGRFYIDGDDALCIFEAEEVGCDTDEVDDGLGDIIVHLGNYR